MNYPKRILLRLIILSIVFLFSIANTWIAEASEEFGAILVAHGDRASGLDLSAFKEKITDRFPDDFKVEIAYLGWVNKKPLADVITKLVKAGKTKILLVHITPSSYSYNEQIEKYASSLVPSKISIVVTAMDDDPLVVAMLEECAKELSKNPEQESLMLIGGGPIEELENTLSLIDLESIGEKIQKDLGLKEVVSLNLRTHSRDVIYVRSINELQREAKRLKSQGRVIVVPYVLQEDFHRQLESYLTGIIPTENICKKDLIIHPNMDQWITKVISAGMNQPQIKKVNDNWSVMIDPQKGQSKEDTPPNYGFEGN